MNKTKKLILNKNTTKKLTIQTRVQTGAPTGTCDSADPGRTYSCSNNGSIMK